MINGTIRAGLLVLFGLVVAFLLLLGIPCRAGASAVAFNFRATAEYVTDAADETYVLKTDIYPVTRNGATFGWVTNGASDGHDISAAGDRRLAGSVHCDSEKTFRYDLPSAGTYTFHMAVGRWSGADNWRHDLRIYDDTTLLASPCDGGACQNAEANTAFDATATEYTIANWPTSETGITLTFATTTAKVEICWVGGTVTMLSHLRFDLAEPTETPTGTPTETPTDTPTQTPAVTPTSTITATPTVTPTSTNTPRPTINPNVSADWYWLYAN